MRAGAVVAGVVTAAAVVLAALGYWALNHTAQPEAPVSVAPPVQAPPADIVTFDLLRAAPDGSITLAGRTQPGARVEVLIDDQVVDTLTAGPDGSFVSLQSGAPSAVARQLRVRVTGDDGVATVSDQMLTVAPAPQAAALAAATAGQSPEAAQQAALALAASPVVADGAGARVLAGASDDLVIDTISVETNGGVQLSGRGAPAGAVLRAYVDNQEFGLSSPDAQGAWRITLPSPAAGDHVLRIDALDAQGKVIGRAEQAFTSTVPEVQPMEATVRMVQIEKGTTLWAVARDAYGDPHMYVRVFEANKDQIRDPDLIYPGQVIAIPDR